MTRTEAIAVITAALPALDDARVAAVADMVQSLTHEPARPLDLTADELAAIERSKEDFKAERTLSSEAYRDEMQAFMSRMAAKYPAAR